MERGNPSLSNLDIAANPRLLERLTRQETEWLTYQQQLERLPQLRKQPSTRKATSVMPDGFLKRD